jgi:isocitrate dehydrogenase
MVNPSSLILSAVMMLEYMGWEEAAKRVEKALEATIEQKTVTYDLQRQMEGATTVSTSKFAENIVKNL